MSTESMTPGKLAGLKAVSEKRGVIAAAAMDQRGSLKKSLAKEKGVAEVPDSALDRVQGTGHRGSDQARLGHPARSRVRPARGEAAQRQGPAAGL